MKHCRMRDGGIVVKPLGAGDDLGQTVYLVWDKTTVLTKACQNFCAFLLDWLPRSGKNQTLNFDWSR